MPKFVVRRKDMCHRKLIFYDIVYLMVVSIEKFLNTLTHNFLPFSVVNSVQAAPSVLSSELSLMISLPCRPTSSASLILTLFIIGSVCCE